MALASELQGREVVNMGNGKKMGVIVDVDLDFDRGRITEVVVEKQEKRFKFFFASSEQLYRVSWNQITSVGDVILVQTYPTEKAQPVYLPVPLTKEAN